MADKWCGLTTFSELYQRLFNLALDMDICYGF